MTTNGDTPDFTNRLGSFTLEGQTFRRWKINARLWAETLQSVASKEKSEIGKEDGLLFAVSAEGLYTLIRIGIDPRDVEAFDDLWHEGRIEFGELTDIRDWMWERMTERPFTSRTASSDGHGNGNGPSSKDGSPSQADALTT